MQKVLKRPPYIEEGEVLYPYEARPPKEAVREMHIFTQAYFDQFQPTPDEDHQRWLGFVSGVTY